MVLTSSPKAAEENKMSEIRQLYVSLPVKALEDLKIRLKYDRISRSDFICLMIESYVSGDQNMRNIIMKYKEEENIGRAEARRIERKVYDKRQENIKDFNLDEEDLKELFDILESEIDHD